MSLLVEYLLSKHEDMSFIPRVYVICQAWQYVSINLAVRNQRQKTSVFMIVQFPSGRETQCSPDLIACLSYVLPYLTKKKPLKNIRAQITGHFPQGVISGAPILLLPPIAVFGTEELYCSKCQSSLHPQVGDTPVSLKSALPLLFIFP